MKKLPTGMTRLNFVDIYIMACLHEGMTVNQVIAHLKMDYSNVGKRLRKMAEIFAPIRKKLESSFNGKRIRRKTSNSLYANRYGRELSKDGAILAKACHDSLNLILDAYELAKKHASEHESSSSDDASGASIPSHLSDIDRQ